MPNSMTIGELGRSTGTKVNTIRFYEEVGLMPKPIRTTSGRRTYGAGDLRRLAFIRHARGLGFATNVIRSLLDLSDCPDRECGEVRELASSHLQEVTVRIGQLKALQTELKRMISACDSGRRVADCRILEAVAERGATADAARAA